MRTPREALVAALEDVKEADVPENLQEIAFSKAFDLHAGLSAPTTPDPLSPARLPAPEGDLLANIANRLQLNQGTVAEVYSIHDGELELIVPQGKLSRRAATGTKEIALIVAGGRQAAGVEEWTSWDRIREVCQEFKRYDPTNFAKTMREMDDVFNERKDSERKMSVRMAKPGWERLTAAIRRLGGE